jgi:hypothetical protein
VHELKAVPVRVKHIGGVVTIAEVAPDPWAIVVDGAGSEGCGIDGVHCGSIRSGDAYV